MVMFAQTTDGLNRVAIVTHSTLDTEEKRNGGLFRIVHVSQNVLQPTCHQLVYSRDLKNASSEMFLWNNFT